MRCERVAGLVAAFSLTVAHAGWRAVAQGPPARVFQIAGEVADLKAVMDGLAAPLPTYNGIETARAARAKNQPGWAAIEDALQRYRVGDRDRARASLEKAAAIDSRIIVRFRAERACERAFLALESSDTEAARIEYDEALRIDPAFVPALRGRAALANRRGERNAALADLKAAVAVEPSDAMAWAEQGTLYIALGKLDAAIPVISEAVRLDPSNPKLLLFRGQTYAARNDLDAAITDLTEAIRLDPHSEQAHRSRYAAREGKYDAQGMIEDAEAVLLLNPKNADGFFKRGWAREMQHRYADAISDYEAALRLRPDRHDLLIHRGRCRCHVGDAPGALADANEVLEADPRSAGAYYVRSLARHRLRDHLGARHDIDEAVQRSPDDPTFLRVRAELLATCVEDRARDGAVALVSARRAVELTKGSDHKALDALAWALAETGDYRAAVARQWETIRHDPAGKAHLVDIFHLMILALRLNYRESSDAPAPLNGNRLSLFAAPLNGAGFVVKIAHDGVFQLSLCRIWSLPALIPALEFYPKTPMVADTKRPTSA